MSPQNSTEVTGWTGWVLFASILMLIGGALTVFVGFLALINNNWSEWNNNGLAYGTVYWTGWWNIILGFIVMAIAGALARGSMFARTMAVIFVSVNLISNFYMVAVAPLWFLTLIVVDVLVLWAIIVHGSELKAI